MTQFAARISYCPIFHGAGLAAQPILRRLALSVVSSASLLASLVAHADMVVLQNGDRITGTVKHKAGDALTVETDYAGPVEIRWSEVKAIQTDVPVEVVVAGEPAAERYWFSGEESDVRLDRIVYINPRPEEWGHAYSYKGRLNVSGARTSGNTDTNRAQADGELVATSKDVRYILSGKARREADSGTKTASSWLGSLKRDHFIVDTTRFIYARGSLEHDRFKDIGLRTALGGGFGWQLVDYDLTKLALGAGLDAVTTQRIAGTDERYPALGWDVRLSHWLGAKAVELLHEQEGYWNLHDTTQVTLRSRTGMRVPVAKGMVANASLNVDWERQPAPGRKPVDTTLLMGLGWEW
jgi:putative salt-induced outer membrane protein YdiY